MVLSELQRCSPSSATMSSRRPAGVEMDLQSFIAQQSRLLSAERAEDVNNAGSAVSQLTDKQLIAAGLALHKLQISDCRGGLYGRCLLTFVPAMGELLPASQISVRDIVRIQPKHQQSSAVQQSAFDDGVVYRITEKFVVVAVENYPDVQQRMGQFTLTRLANEIVYQRYQAALKQLADRGLHAQESSRAIQLLYGAASPSSVTPPPAIRLSASGVQHQLNQVQHTAIERALAANDVFVIHGPPGTGKTTTLVELVVQCVARGEKVLACAPSNIAVDNLVERIVQAATYNASHQPKHSSTAPVSASPFHSFRCIRVGHPARLSPAILSHSLDSVVKQSDGGSITRDIEAEIAQTQTDINKSRDRNEKKALRGQWKMLQKELRERQKKAVRDALSAASVLCCTLIGAASSSLASMSFDTVIIDECAQAIEAACLIPLLLCKRRLVLAGDHRQLGPVVKSKEAGGAELEVTLMDRVNRRPDSEQLTEMLVEQFRMNEEIMQWSSDEFYQSRLTAPDDVRRRRLTDLPGVTSDVITQAPLVFIDTAGCEMYEDESESEGGAEKKVDTYAMFAQSKSNKHETALIHHHITRLLACQVPLSSITVLSPYLAQVSALRDRLLPVYPQLEIGTIDSMQGRENDAVLISCVRSSDAGGTKGVGFLSDERRLNVAITRGRRQVCVVADSETLGQDAFLKRLVNYLSNNERVEYISAVEYQDGATNAGVAVPQVVTVEAAAATAESKPAQTKRTTNPSAATEAPQPTASLVADATAASAAASTAPAPTEVWDRERIISLCEDVLKGRKAYYAFPPSLSSVDRRLVHDVAEELGGDRLQHVSEGSGHKRRITLRMAAVAAASRLTLTPTSAAANRQSSKEEQRAAAIARMEATAKPKHAASHLTNERKAEESQPPQPAVTAVQIARVLMQGVEPDEDDDQDSGSRTTQSSEEKAPTAALAATKRNKKVAKATQSKQQLTADQQLDADDGLDSFLDSLAKGVSICASPACSQRCIAMGAVCRYCNLCYCLSHANSILHGCAGDAKEDALRRDLERYQAREQGRRVGGLKDGERRILSEKLAKKAEAARKEGEVESKKKEQQKKKEANKR